MTVTRRKQEVKPGITWDGAPEILSLKQSAELLGVGYTSARNLVINGTVPNVRIGLSYKIPKAGLWQWFQQQSDANRYNYKK